jgi:pimeloyl-ACP methyl ester carboxylesterase
MIQKFYGLCLMVLLMGCSRAVATGVATTPPPAIEISESETAVPTPTLLPEPTAIKVPIGVETPMEATPEAADEAMSGEEAVLEETEPTPTVRVPESGERVTETVPFTAVDGLEIQATFYGTRQGAAQPGILLLHMLGSNRGVWADNGLANLLADNSFAVLAIDMRGHGETGGRRDWATVERDVQQIWQEFTNWPEVDRERTAVIGASIGSNMALIAAANEPAIKTVVLLSPGLNYAGVTTEDRIVAYGGRPILIVASAEDSYAAQSSRRLQETAVGSAELQMYNGAGHGTNMFGSEPELANLILNWLNEHVAGMVEP